MTAKTIADQDKKSPQHKDELDSSELAKVTGGMKPAGGLKSTKNVAIIGDPDEGGE